VSNLLLQNNEQQEEEVHYNVNQLARDRSINNRFVHKPNFIKLWRNEHWEKYNTEKYSGFSYASFMEAMEEVKYDRVEHHSEDFYKIMGIPEPDQYKAFIRLHELVNDDDFFAKHPKTLSNHARLPRYPGTLKLLRDVYLNYDKDPVKDITISCGSFYRRYLWVRTEVIKYLNWLYEKGVKIEIYANCKANEDHINKLNKNIHFEPLDNRVMIHFILVDDKIIKFYYPHSENIYQRLSILLTPEDLNTKLIQKKTALFLFFNNLISEARNKK
jgi:hypothetical protein